MTILTETSPSPPTEDDLPCDDDRPMETPRHRAQLNLLEETLKIAWADRRDVFVGGNMFVYFSPDQVLTHDFRGPDFFVVLDVPSRERKSWLVWAEGKGPDVVIELLSESMAAADKTEKKLIYQTRLRVPEYFWFDPFNGELAGFALRRHKYEPIHPDAAGRFISQVLDLALVRWTGTFQGIEATWLRWATPAGALLPTQQEITQVEQQAALKAKQQAAEAEQRAADLEAELARYRKKFGDLSERE